MNGWGIKHKKCGGDTAIYFQVQEARRLKHLLREKTLFAFSIFMFGKPLFCGFNEHVLKTIWFDISFPGDPRQFVASYSECVLERALKATPTVRQRSFLKFPLICFVARF